MVQRNNLQDVEQLTFVLVHTLDLHVKTCLRIDFLPCFLVKIVAKVDFVVSFDFLQSVQHFAVIGKLLKPFELAHTL